MIVILSEARRSEATKHESKDPYSLKFSPAISRHSHDATGREAAQEFSLRCCLHGTNVVFGWRSTLRCGGSAVFAWAASDVEVMTGIKINLVCVFPVLHKKDYTSTRCTQKK